MMRLVGAGAFQLFSYLATALAVAHVLRPSDETSWIVALAVALAVEAALFALKESLFDPKASSAVGIVGLLLDTLVNAGGIMLYAGAILTLSGLAAILGIAGVDLADPETQLVAGGIVSGLLGLLLAIAPHWLWRRR